MMRIFFTFVLILEFSQCGKMNLSDAQPLQFFPLGATYNETVYGYVDTKSYTHLWQCDDNIKCQVSNEAQTSKDYRLKVLDQNLNIIEFIDYIKTFITGPQIVSPLQFANTTFPSVLTPWINFAVADTRDRFIWQSAGSILSDCTASGNRFSPILAQPRPDGYPYGWPPGNYTIHLVGVNNATGSNASQLGATVYGSQNIFTGLDVATLGSHGATIATGAFDITVNFTTTQYWNEIGVSLGIGPPSNVTKTYLNKYELTLAPTSETLAEFDLNFTASSLPTPICNQIVKFILQQKPYNYQGSILASGGLLPTLEATGGTIRQWDAWLVAGTGTLNGVTVTDGDYLVALIDTPGTTTANWSSTTYELAPGQDIFETDPHQFVSTVVINKSNGSKVLNYKSIKNFAGINYPNDGVYFSLRVPCRFYDTQNAKTQNSLPLSGSQIVTTAIESTRQQYFETALIPPYMLDKLELIFQHCVTGSLQIDGVEWQADESFDRSNPDARSAFRKGKIWLTKDIIRNVI